MYAIVTDNGTLQYWSGVECCSPHTTANATYVCINKLVKGLLVHYNSVETVFDLTQLSVDKQ